MSVDYSFYTAVFDGVLIPEAAFSRMAKRAEETLSADTNGHSVAALAAGTEDAPAVRLCLCALAELCWQAQPPTTEGRALAKESVGSWSREYALPQSSGALRRQVVAAEAKYLGSTGLLYRGRQRYV